ncbi:hypothetical protein [Streptomyces sp. PU-14G]|uniref:hypothetical protein n=1 Tax=Streptomyces sp. PU-14G TaxID=2800808 RepID=UPI0034E02411
MTLTITLADTPGDYLAAALAGPVGPAGPPPGALDPRGHHRWPRRIAARLGVATAPAARDTPAGAGGATPEEAVAALRDARSEHLVIALAPMDGTAPATRPGDAGPRGTVGDFAFAAAAFAWAKHAQLRITHDEDAVLGAVHAVAPRFVTLIGPAALLGFGLTTRIRSRFPHLELGVLHAHTPAKLSELVLKTVLYPRLPAAEDVLVAPLLKGEEPLHNGRLTIHPQDAVDPAALAHPAAGEADATATGQRAGLLRLFSVITHGSEDYLRLTPHDLLCGRTDDPEKLEAARRQPGATLPACMHGDGCVYPEARRWDPASITAQLVFANACLTVKLGTQLFGGRGSFTVAQRFLDAWAGSYIASPLLKDGTHGENLLFHYLLEEGHTVGAAVRQVNESLHRWGIDAPEVLVIGDPEARYAPERARPLPDAVSYQESPGRAEITFEGTLPAFTRVRLKGPELRDAHRQGRLTVAPVVPFGGKLPVYGSVTEGEDGELNALVFGFRERPLTGTETSRSVAVEPRRTSAADRIVRAVERYENLACLDIKLDKARSVLTDTANSLPAVARRTRTAASELTQSEPLHKATERILANCARLDQHLLSTLLRLTETREYHFVEAYRPAYAVQRVESPYAACVYCGEATHRYTSAHVLRPRLRRLLITCPVCGATQDTEDDTLTLMVEGDPVLVPGGQTRLRLRLTNDGEDDRDVLLGARITRGKPHGFGFDLDPGTVRVPAGGSADVRLSITTGEPLNRHAMLLRCYAVGEGRIDFAGRDLRFAPSR